MLRPLEILDTVEDRKMRYAVAERSKMTIVMINRIQLMPLRSVPPLSAKTSHRRHSRNEAIYTPITTDSAVTAIINPWTDGPGNISRVRYQHLTRCWYLYCEL